jgi:hypothetical protein
MRKEDYCHHASNSLSAVKFQLRRECDAETISWLAGPAIMEHDMSVALSAITRQGKLGTLSRIHAFLEVEGIQTREQFWDMMKVAASELDIDRAALAKDLSYSPSSVYRWFDGKAAPHPSGWPQITAWVMARLQEHILLIEHEIGQHEAALPN